MKKHSHKKFQAMIENADWKDYSDRVLKKIFCIADRHERARHLSWNKLHKKKA